jgi:hypothetical protein
MCPQYIRRKMCPNWLMRSQDWRDQGRRGQADLPGLPRPKRPSFVYSKRRKLWRGIGSRGLSPFDTQRRRSNKLRLLSSLTRTQTRPMLRRQARSTPGRGTNCHLTCCHSWSAALQCFEIVRMSVCTFATSSGTPSTPCSVSLGLLPAFSGLTPVLIIPDRNVPFTSTSWWS